MWKQVAWSGRLSLVLSICLFCSGGILLYGEIKSKTFVIHQSMAIAFLLLSIGLFFHYRIKVLDRSD